MRVLAVIPARSGSKGIKDKNIKFLRGKPLLSYSIEAAIQSKIFDTIHVSTDSEKYADVSRTYGADVPFLRNSEFSRDDSTTWDVIKYVLEEYRIRDKNFDVIVVLQPTSPLRNSEHIKNAWKFFLEKDADMVSSVCEAGCSPLWCNILPENLSLEQFENKEIAYLPRQCLPTYYHENGAIYIIKSNTLLTSDNVYKKNSYAYIMEKLYSVDIDDEIDFALAEVLMDKIQKGEI